MRQCRNTLAALLILLQPLAGCSGDPNIEVPKLKAQLRSTASNERNKAALSLASYGKAAQPAVPDLIRLLNDPNGGVRSSAAYALRQINTPEARRALKAAEEGK